MRTLPLRLLLGLLVAAPLGFTGCGDDGLPGGGGDAAAKPVDQSAAKPDLGATPDLAEARDFTVTSGDDGGAPGDDASGPGDDAGGPGGDATLGGVDGGAPADLATGGGDMTKPAQGMPTVFLVIFENKGYKEIIGSQNAPYFNSLLKLGGLATAYKDSGTHPSLPNYLYLTSGDTQYIGFVDLDPTFFPFPVNKPNLGEQLEAAKIPWRAYMESMGTPCRLVSSGPYAPKHNPFVYFTGIQKNMPLCQKRDRDYLDFAQDLASGAYRFMWITPNLTNDGHDPQNDTKQAVMQADAWAAKEIQHILDSDAYKAGGVLFITWDEGDTSDADRVPMIVLSPNIKKPGMTSATAFTHAAWLATVEDMFKLPRLGAAKNVKATLKEFLQ